eukprot:m.111776 g.111776  ORF g.111776 m.111776 type:complete len:882 (+) comp10763_c0_seq1:57-2702(+)
MSLIKTATAALSLTLPWVFAVAQIACNDADNSGLALPSNPTQAAGCDELANNGACSGTTHGLRVRQACPASCCACDETCINNGPSAIQGRNTSDSKDFGTTHLALIVVIVVALLIVLFLVGVFISTKRRGDAVLAVRGVAEFESHQKRKESTDMYHFTSTDADTMVGGSETYTDTPASPGHAKPFLSPLPSWDDESSKLHDSPRDDPLSPYSPSHHGSASRRADAPDKAEALTKSPLTRSQGPAGTQQHGEDDAFPTLAEYNQSLPSVDYSSSDGGLSVRHDDNALHESLAMIDDAISVLDEWETGGLPAVLPDNGVTTGEEFLILLHNALLSGRDLGKLRRALDNARRGSEADVGLARRTEDDTMARLVTLLITLTRSSGDAAAHLAPLDALHAHYGAFLLRVLDPLLPDSERAANLPVVPLREASPVTAVLASYGTWMELRLYNTDDDGCISVGEFFDVLARKCLASNSIEPSPQPGTAAASAAAAVFRRTASDRRRRHPSYGANQSVMSVGDGASKMSVSRETDWGDGGASERYDDARSDHTQRFGRQGSGSTRRLSLSGMTEEDARTDEQEVAGVPREDSATEDPSLFDLPPQLSQRLSERAVAPHPHDRITPKHPVRVNMETGRASDLNETTEQGRVERVISATRDYIRRLEEISQSSVGGIFPEHVATTLIPRCFSDIQQAYSLPIDALKDHLNFLYRDSTIYKTDEFGVWTKFSWSRFWVNVHAHLDTEQDGHCNIEAFIRMLTDTIRTSHLSAAEARRDAGLGRGRIVYLEESSSRGSSPASAASPLSPAHRDAQAGGRPAPLYDMAGQSAPLYDTALPGVDPLYDEATNAVVYSTVATDRPSARRYNVGEQDGADHVVYASVNTGGMHGTGE